MVKFSPYEISLCLYDKERTNRFAKAIKETVKKGDIVVDAGSGTGVLGLLAAKAGAKKVYCIELQPRFIEIIKKNAELNNLQDKIVVIQGDATKVKLPEKVDVIICELLSTGLFFEPETEVLDHLRQFLKKKGRIIPQECVSWIQLVKAQKSSYGLYLNYDSRTERLNDKGLSNKVVFDELAFQEKEEPLVIDTKVTVKASNNGTVNAVRITSKAKLSDNTYTRQSKFLFNPMIIYLKDPINIKKGEKYSIHIKYKRGEDTLGTKIEVEEV